VVTKANEAKREVVEFDHKPAAQAYADALGISIEESAGRFLQSPVGEIIDGEPFVRSQQQIKDGSMFFYCGVAEGMVLSILESTDMVEDTRKALEKAKADLGGISGIIKFNCILRTLELEEKQATQRYGALFAGYPTAGFSTYGEQYFGHLNRTATMLIFK
jgi:hypothetical protein